MKKIFFAVVAGYAFLLSSCGSEVQVTATVPVTVAYAPTISLVHYTPDYAFLGDGHGIVTVSGTVDFVDPDADISTMTLSVVDSQGFLVSRSVSPLPAFYGYSQGTVFFAIDFSTLAVDTYTFSVSLSDSAGNMSNPVFGAFRVVR